MRLEAHAAAPGAEWTETYLQQFRSAMDDDFTSAGALGVLFELARATNRRRASGELSTSAGQALLVELADVLGLDLLSSAAESGSAAEPFVELLINVRKHLREARQWQLADLIRNELRARGVILEDQPGGSVWRWARPGE